MKDRIMNDPGDGVDRRRFLKGWPIGPETVRGYCLFVNNGERSAIPSGPPPLFLSFERSTPMFDFLRRWCIGSPRMRQITTKDPEHRYVPRLEVLEDRSALAVFKGDSMAEFVKPLVGVENLHPASEGFKSLSPATAVSPQFPISTASMVESIWLAAAFFDGWLDGTDLDDEKAVLVLLNLGVAVAVPAQISKPTERES
jgi:hypothetical protein